MDLIVLPWQMLGSELERSFGDLVKATEERDPKLFIGDLVDTLDTISGIESEEIVRELVGAINGRDAEFSVGDVVITLEANFGVEFK